MGDEDVKPLVFLFLMVVFFLQVGDRITAGDIYGIVHENSLVEHRIMLPPGAKGVVSYIAPSGNYNVNEEIIEVDFMGHKKVGYP